MAKYILLVALNLLILTIHIWTSEGARILGIFYVKSKSHHSIHESVLRSLATRGHQITALTVLPMKLPSANYTEIMFTSPKLISWEDSLTVDQTKSFISITYWLSEGSVQDKMFCEEQMGHPFIKDLIASQTRQFDLLITESFGSRCSSLLALKLDVPMILVSALGQYMAVDTWAGNPSSPSFMPCLFLPFTTNMNFMQRLQNTINYLILYINSGLFSQRFLRDIAADFFHMEVPSETSLDERLAMVFYNNHEVFIPRPMAPTSVNIGGIHIKESRPLPSEIQKLVDEAKHGVILFSLGTTIKASSIHTQKLDIIMRVLAKIPQTILWRTNEPSATDFPPNVKPLYWIPQRDLLEHKNVRAFISHCGQLGTFEAIYTATPVIALPISFDQLQNAAILKEKGVATYVDYDSLNETDFFNSIDSVINDSRYKEKMEKLSAIFRDRPMSPSDAVIYWTEHVLKHRGAGHLRTAAVDMPWYKYLLLDVIVVVSAVAGLFLYIFILGVKKCLRGCKSKNKYKIQ